MRWLILGVALSVACRGPVEPAAPKGGAESAMAELRFRIASAPKDFSAHLGLARLAVDNHLPGAALRHYQVVARNRALVARDRERLAALLAARAAERVALGDGGAIEDVRAARRYLPDVKLDAGVEAEALGLAALAALRRRDRPALEVALVALAGLEPSDPRPAALDPEGAALPRLAAAGAWAWDGNARREALRLLEAYVVRGGRDAGTLERFARARYWWKGAPGLSYLERSMLVDAGVDLCVVARAVDERGCDLEAPREAARARELERRGARLHWPVPAGGVSREDAGEPAARRSSAGVAAIAEAYRTDPALADRLARDYADGVHAIGGRGGELAGLFADLGDPARALRWWEQVSSSSPAHAPYTRALALAAVAVGDAERALVHGYEAALQSGDAGAVHLDLAEALLAAGRPAKALYAARNAVNLTAPTEQVDALAVVVQATLGLRRPREHARARAAYLARIDPRYRERASAWLDELTAAWVGASGR